MNQNPNQNPRGVQTPPRPQVNPQKRPIAGARPQPKPQKTFDVSGAFWAVLGVTVVLLVAMLITMTVLLIADTATPFSPDAPSGDAPTTQKPSDNGDTTVTPTPSAPSTKTGIALPSVTKAGTYAVSAASATDISDNSAIASQAIALIDVTNGRAVASKSGSEKIYPASMTKVMTVLLACEKATNPLALLTVSDEMIQKYKTLDNPSTAHTWQAGYQVTVEDALYMAIYKSDTYACWLLAEHVAGSEEAFVRMMNERAASLGCTNTNFKNCTGLFEEDHYTTAFDMAAIMAAAMNNAAATKVMTTYEQYVADIYINGTKMSNLAVPMWSGWYTGRLEAYPFVSSSGKKATKYAGNGSNVELIAGKTGYEDIPTNCFVTAGRDDQTGVLYVCVQVGRLSQSGNAVNSSTSTADTRRVYYTYAKS